MRGTRKRSLRVAKCFLWESDTPSGLPCSLGNLNHQLKGLTSGNESGIGR